jgi:hypothetical protein
METMNHLNFPDHILHRRVELFCSRDWGHADHRASPANELQLAVHWSRCEHTRPALQNAELAWLGSRRHRSMRIELRFIDNKS